MTDLHLHELGSGPVTLLVHAGVADSRGWLPVAERLAAAGRRALVPDLRGYGRSPDPDRDFLHRDDLAAIIEDVGDGEPVQLAGWSMGGAIALELALLRPELVSTLAMVCSIAHGMPRSSFVQQSWEREERLLESGDVDGAIANDVATWAVGPGRTIDDVDAAIVRHVDEVGRDLMAREPRARGAAQDGDEQLLARLEQLAMPLLVVVAEHDTPCHEPAAVELLRRAPRASRVDVAGAAHLAPLERPEEVAEALLAHARVVAPGSG